MNEITVKNILDVVKKSSDKNVILKALVKLRTDVVKDRDGIIVFRECNGVPPLIRLLNRPNEKILEVTLSILGNCCTDQTCCVQAFENKIIPPLLTILKSVPNPLILSRGCRLLGNLAKENKSQLILHSGTISQSLCMIIEETTDIQTTIMSIRAIKILLTEKLFLKNFIRGNGFKILLKILIKMIKNPNRNVDTNNGNNSSNENQNENDEQSDKQKIGLKSCQHREKYFEEVARNLEGVRSDIFDVYNLKMQTKKRTINNDFILPDDKILNDIINEILKCILCITEYCTNPITLGIYDHYHNHGISLSCIVFFIEINHNIYRSIALKTISNFANNPIAIPVLCSTDAISAACELLTKEDLNPSLTESEIRNCIRIICMLAGDACNRAKIRMSGALKKLIKRAKISDSCIEITMILFAFNHFQYDILSMDLLLREGLVSILIKELDAYLNSTDKYRKGKCEEKQRMTRKRKAEEMSKTCSKNPKTWADLFEPDSPISTCTPPYVSSPSPCSSRSMSPINTLTKHFYDEDNESDSYSPVCSGDESESVDGDKTKSNDDHDVMKLLDVVMKNENNSNETLSDKEDEEVNEGNNAQEKDANNYKLPSSVNHPTNAIDIIDNLLLRISLHINNRGELSKPETLKTIIQALTIFGLSGNNFWNSLSNILLESQFFVQILKQDTVHRIYQLSKIEEIKNSGTNFFESLTCVGESGYGRGELTRLLKSELNTQKRAAIAVSFIIRTPKILYQLLTENGALYTLINTILNKGDECCFEAADGITSLSQSLGIDIPEYDNLMFNENHEFDETTMNLTNTQNSDDNNKNDNDDEMKFILHRGCSKIPIKFKKHLLIECSDVFKSMLSSDFKECNEGEIHLKDYSVNGIKYFLNLIQLNSINKLPNVPPIYHFDSLLEAYELSRMYMMKEFEVKLFNMILYRLCSRTALKIFQWSLKNFNQELSEIIINYYLSSELNNRDKVDLYREADYCEYSKEWNQMIIDAVLVKCQNLCIDG